MKAILIREPGGPEVLVVGEVPRPELGPGEIRARVHATALNGADLLQRRGLYPAPKGESPLLGLEAAGEIMELGAGVHDLRVGDRVMALLGGGGYAEEAVFPAGMALAIPPGFSFEEAAAIPEVFLTAWLELFELGGLQAGETLLVHSGASGVGTAAIQLAKEKGARVIATAGSDGKLLRCRELGADLAVNYRTDDFGVRTKEFTQGRGADCILDLVGAAHWARNIEAIATGGRWLLVGLSGGAKTEIDLRALLTRRVHLIASTLRARSLDEKLELTR